MLTAILLIFLLAALCLALRGKYTKLLGWFLAIIPIGIFIYLLTFLNTVLAGQPILQQTPWLSAFGVNLDFYLDGLSLLFGLLITGIGALIIIYSSAYLENHPQLDRYYCYLFLFMGAMLGTVLANNLITLFIFWELTSITSYLLISFNHENHAARRAAFQGLIVTASGGLAMLAGFVLISMITHSFTISQILNAHKLLTSSPFYTGIIILVLLGAFTKSAQYPFHFWLPNAMQAPTPVSAYLHSATMVKLGIYLVARLTPALGHTPLWTNLIVTISSITMITSAIMSLRATDMKLILAYSTIMALGTLLFLLATGNKVSVEAAMTFLIAHALYKGALFLCTGNIDHETGNRNLLQLGGLLKYLPVTFFAVLLAAISMAGLPPVVGFISKEMVYEAKLADPNTPYLLTSIAFLTNMVFTTIAFLFVAKPFFGELSTQLQKVPEHDAPFNMTFAPIILGVLGLFFGLHPFLAAHYFVAPASSSILQNSVLTELKLWHGFTWALALSIATILSAVIIFLIYPALHKSLKKAKLIDIISPSAFYEYSLKLIHLVCSLLTNAIQIGYLRIYTSIVFVTLIILVGLGYFDFNDVAPLSIMPHAPWFDWFVCILMSIAALATILTAPYLASLAFLAIVGFGSTIIFIIYSAPDVAMTQLLVDVLTIVIVVLALYRLPALPTLRPMAKHIAWRNAIIATIAGLLITTLLLSVISLPFDSFISTFYKNYSLKLAQGENIVNVILVDFRAFDTLGEMIVVAIAGLGVYGLLKTKQPKEKA